MNEEIIITNFKYISEGIQIILKAQNIFRERTDHLLYNTLKEENNKLQHKRYNITITILQTLEKLELVLEQIIASIIEIRNIINIRYPNIIIIPLNQNIIDTTIENIQPSINNKLNDLKNIVENTNQEQFIKKYYLKTLIKGFLRLKTGLRIDILRQYIPEHQQNTISILQKIENTFFHNTTNIDQIDYLLKVLTHIEEEQIFWRSPIPRKIFVQNEHTQKIRQLNLTPIKVDYIKLPTQEHIKKQVIKTITV
jgi:hypothetical protein